jgi:hypothetical protein
MFSAVMKNVFAKYLCKRAREMALKINGSMEKRKLGGRMSERWGESG